MLFLAFVALLFFVEAAAVDAAFFCILASSPVAAAAVDLLVFSCFAAVVCLLFSDCFGADVGVPVVTSATSAYDASTTDACNDTDTIRWRRKPVSARAIQLVARTP